MTSFLAVIKRSIKTKAFAKDYYQEVIAKWNLNGWLTEAETAEALAYLEEVFPSPVEVK
jgi:SOS response regulatory protein OraA/RecX